MATKSGLLLLTELPFSLNFIGCVCPLTSQLDLFLSRGNTLSLVARTLEMNRAEYHYESLENGRVGNEIRNFIVKSCQCGNYLELTGATKSELILCMFEAILSKKIIPC